MQRDVHKKGTRLLDDFSICVDGRCLVFCACCFVCYSCTLSERNMEEIHLLCTLFPLDSPLHDTIVVRLNCCCAHPVEGVYYTATVKKFPPVCGMAEGFATESIAELQRQYAVFCPLYFLCQLDDKTHKVGVPTTLSRENEVISSE